MALVGVCECFFGPPWSREQRKSWADFLQKMDMNFYLYGPKEDQQLRKLWLEEWPKDYLTYLNDLVSYFHLRNIKIGIALSPFGINSIKDKKIKDIFIQKIEILTNLKFDYIGLFFDDMKYVEGLLQTQIEILNLAKAHTSAKIIFCPTYYTYDPILDKVFGQRPEYYLKDVGTLVPADIEICWTGPKVISAEISDEHLIEVSQILQRKPFLFDNIFANDGPKNCKFLKLKPFAGRSENLVKNISGIILNPMNQSFFSQIVVASAQKVLTEGINPNQALEDSVKELCSSITAEVVLKNLNLFLNEGLDKIVESHKIEMIIQLNDFQDQASIELIKWLEGNYTVGVECLTD